MIGSDQPAEPQLQLSSRALSPLRCLTLHELDGLLRGLTGLNGSSMPQDWAKAMRPRLQQLRQTTELDAVLALQRVDGGAEFMVPPPTNADQTIAEDFAAVTDTPDDVVDSEVQECLTRRLVRPATVRRTLLADDAATRLATALQEAWTSLLEPRWPTIQATCQRDIACRAERLGRGGWPAAFHDMHERLHWDVHENLDRRRRQPQGRGGAEGMLLIPSAFVHPALAVLDSRPWPTAMVHPARGFRLLWG